MQMLLHRAPTPPREEGGGPRERAAQDAQGQTASPRLSDTDVSNQSELAILRARIVSLERKNRQVEERNNALQIRNRVLEEEAVMLRKQCTEYRSRAEDGIYRTV